MKSIALITLLLLASLSAMPASASCGTQSVTALGTHVEYSNTCTADNDVLVTTNDVSRYTECSIISTTGAVDVFVTNDGTNYVTAPISLVDLGATSTAPVLVTAALRYYAFPLVGIRKIKVLQNGATGAAATLSCK